MHSIQNILANCQQPLAPELVLLWFLIIIVAHQVDGQCIGFAVVRSELLVSILE